MCVCTRVRVCACVCVYIHTHFFFISVSNLYIYSPSASNSALACLKPQQQTNPGRNSDFQIISRLTPTLSRPPSGPGLHRLTAPRPILTQTGC